LPSQFRHELEVHAVDSGDYGRRNTNQRDDGQNFEQIILFDGDKPEDRIEQELHFVRNVTLKVIQRSDVTIETRKAALVKLLRKADYGIFLNEHVEDEAAIVFQHACKLGLEGIVSKRRARRTSVRPGECCIHFDKDHCLAVNEAMNRVMLQITTGPIGS
jgi:hypothetical protein